MTTSSTTSEPEAPPSVFDVIPGGSLILQMPGSGLLRRGENAVRGVVASGLRWALGPAVFDPDQATAAAIDQTETRYNALHSAVQELVDAFDSDSRDAESTSDLTGIDLLRATKIRVKSLEDEIKAERQARKSAESRIGTSAGRGPAALTTTN